MKIYYTSECLSYNQPGHPESPERIHTIHNLLMQKDFHFTNPDPCTKEDILRTHSPDHLECVKNGTFFDMDTPAYPGIYAIALLSAGSAIQTAESAITDGHAFSLMRPPGHHATKNRVMGFCYFNNIAIATAKYLVNNSNHKVAILDIDCHHGNGTEDIFTNNPSVLYISLHQSPLYPGTGLNSTDNCINYPLPPGTDEVQYLETLDSACEKIKKFNPGLIGISAGFDTFSGDPISNFGLHVESYFKIAKKIKEFKKPTFHIMEGGYSTDLPQCVYEYLRGLN